MSVRSIVRPSFTPAKRKRRPPRLRKRDGINLANLTAPLLRRSPQPENFTLPKSTTKSTSRNIRAGTLATCCALHRRGNRREEVDSPAAAEDHFREEVNQLGTGFGSQTR